MNVRKRTALSDTERKYKNFDKWSKFFVWPLVLPAAILTLALIFAKDDATMIFIAVLLIVWTIVMIVACSLIGKRRAALEEKLWEERNSIRRTGVFKELYEEFRHDGLEFRVLSDEFLFDDCHKNSIEFGFIRNGHEFMVLIDENAVSVLVDEETDHPAEKEIPLAEIKSVDHFYEVLNGFAEEYV